MTSGTRRAPAPHFGQEITTSSTNGRCGSSADRSASDPAQVTCSSGHSHSGSGVPQYLVRDTAQSTLFLRHSPYLPCLMVGGCQLVCSFCASSWSLTAVVRMYQEGWA